MTSKELRRRRWKVYKVAFKVARSYAWLHYGQKIFGKSFAEKRIDATHEKNAQLLEVKFSELQGLFIKVGQLISALSHVLPETYNRVFESMQDDTNTDNEPFEEVIPRIYQKEASEIFEKWEGNCVASASIGKVYKAKLNSGKWIALKVQHANIQELAAADLDSIKKVLGWTNRVFKIQGFEFIFQQIEKMILEELDYENEVQNANLISQNLSKNDGVLIPKILDEYSNSEVIVSEWHDGFKITNREKLLENNLDPNEIAGKLVKTYFKMILEDGVFHADPHPGNILVNSKGQIILLDFGAISTLRKELKEEIPKFLQAALAKNDGQMLRSLKIMGFVGDNQEAEIVTKKIISAMSEFMHNELNIKEANLDQINVGDFKGSSLDNLRKEIGIRELTKSVRIPKDWVLLDRTIQLLFGTTKQISPDFNPMSVIRPFLRNLIFNKNNWKQVVLNEIKKKVIGLWQLPENLNEYLTRTPQVEASANKSFSVNGIIFCLLLIASFVLWRIEDEPIYAISSIFFGWMMIREIRK